MRIVLNMGIAYLFDTSRLRWQWPGIGDEQELRPALGPGGRFGGVVTWRV
jgi:hypothetical protein